MNLLKLFNKKDNQKTEEPIKITYNISRSRTTETRTGDRVMETFFEEVKIEGSGEEFKNLATNIVLTGRQAEQQLLSEQVERPVKQFRPMQIVNE
jgi:hypothetical protein